jgi:hypothetical protein
VKPSTTVRIRGPLLAASPSATKIDRIPDSVRSENTASSARPQEPLALQASLRQGLFKANI